MRKWDLLQRDVGASFEELMEFVARGDDLGRVRGTNPRGQPDGASSLSPPITEINPTHRQFLHPHTVLDLGRAPPATPAAGRPA